MTVSHTADSDTNWISRHKGQKYYNILYLYYLNYNLSYNSCHIDISKKSLLNLDKPPTGPGMIKLQASNSNGVHVGQIQYAGQNVASNIWMDEDKDPKYRYCACDRYDEQCTDSQV